MNALHNTAKKAAIALLLPLMISACSGSAPRSGNLLADAYSTPGIMKVKPYTRTIFSSTDF